MLLRKKHRQDLFCDMERIYKHPMEALAQKKGEGIYGGI